MCSPDATELFNALFTMGVDPRAEASRQLMSLPWVLQIQYNYLYSVGTFEQKLS